MSTNKQKSSEPRHDEANADEPPPDSREGQSGAQAGNPAMKHKTGTPEDLARMDDDGAARKPRRG